MRPALRDLEDGNDVGQTLALIHTSPTLTLMFSELCAVYLQETSIFHMVDESLIRETIREGQLRRVTMRRLLSTIESAAAAGMADHTASISAEGFREQCCGEAIILCQSDCVALSPEKYPMILPMSALGTQHATTPSGPIAMPVQPPTVPPIAAPAITPPQPNATV
jgi:hypothetical protein